MEHQDIQIKKVAELEFARGKVGYGYELADEAAEIAHLHGLTANTLPLTVLDTADCGDERRILSMADGTSSPDVLADRVARQLFGGIGLATTKALVAANAVIVRDAKNMQQAYELTVETLGKLGYKDAAHNNCGASIGVEVSVANPIDFEALTPAVQLLVPAHIANERRLQKIGATKQQRLGEGYYSEWSPEWHVDYVTSRFPENFSNLAVDMKDTETKGHHGSSLYVITSEGRGFAKNAFIDSTGGQEAFCNTLSMMQELAYKLGGTDEERADILTAFADDAYHVGAGIVRKGMPAFAEVA